MLHGSVGDRAYLRVGKSYVIRCSKGKRIKKAGSLMTALPVWELTRKASPPKDHVIPDRDELF